MKPRVTRIELIRDKQDFSANVSFIQGALPDLLLYLDKLHSEEEAVYNSYQHKRRKESYLLGRLSAKEAVLSLTNINQPKSIWIDTGVFQFPIVKCPSLSNVQVSISHCDTIGFSIAYPEAHPMGIDVERIQTDRMALILSQLTDNEKLLLTQQNKNNITSCTALFSIKEALSKIIRTGMMLDFKFLEVDTFSQNKKVVECTFTHFGQYRAFAYSIGNYVFSLVLPKRTSVNLIQVWKMLEEECLNYEFTLKTAQLGELRYIS